MRSSTLFEPMPWTYEGRFRRGGEGRNWISARNIKRHLAMSGISEHSKVRFVIMWD